MDLLYLIDRLEEQVAGAQRMPIGNRAVVGRGELLDTIDQLRIAIPDEVREAREIVAEMDAIRRNTEEEARLMLARAEEQAAALLAGHRLTSLARERADGIVAEAEARAVDRADDANAEMAGRIDESRVLASQQMAAADEYARRLLTRLDHQLRSFQRSVQSGLEQLSEEPPGTTPTPVASTGQMVSGEQMDGFMADAGAAPRSLADAGLRAMGVAEPEEPAAFPHPAPPSAGAHIEPVPVEVEDGVIDDFAMPSLDDERARFELIGSRAEQAPARPAPVEEPEAEAPHAVITGRTPGNGAS